MADPFPGQHTTTTRVTTTRTEVITDLRYDPSYLKTFPGLVKCVQLVCNILGFISIICARYSHLGRGTFFKFVSGTGFWFTGFLLLFYVFHVIEKSFKIPWLKIEFVFCSAWTLFYLISSILCADYTSLDGAFGAAAFFGFCSMTAYAFDAYLKFMAVRNGELAQGERVMSQTTRTVSTA